ncbi:MAG: tetratricopeptide repeat-containing glycosyltransferase family protein, partial [Planctomycetes bacterium]|nr:tetratricopeptide repeat-containing glycosyltransferase family protein [Planctomycetota bacterium]
MSAAAQLAAGWKLHQAGDYAGAEGCYQAVLTADPYHANAWCYLGMLRHDRKLYSEAKSAYERSLALAPGAAVTHNNLGNTLVAMDRREEAIACFERAAALQPRYPNAYKNKGSSLTWLGRLDEAAASFRQALALAPEDPQTHRDLGVVLLLQGRFQEGWAEYQYRWRTPNLSLPALRRPMWDGSSLDGRTIFLLAEQGFGDTIHFIRYAARLKQLYDCRVVASCHKPLLPLLSSVSGPDALIPLGGEPVRYDAFAPLLSVPGILNDTPSTFPADVPYLHAHQERVERWEKKLAGCEGLRVGIAWQGSPAFEADAMRSAPLSAFLPLARVPGVTLVSLQKGFGEEQLPPLSDRLSAIPLGPRLDAEGAAFLDTAAVIKSLDLVITVDTSIGHLAGALGAPTWLALAYVPDWRWGMTGERSVWYPTMRLFRQTRRGDWSTVFKPMAEALARLAANVGEPPRPVTQAARLCGATIESTAAVPAPLVVEISPGELLDKITILEIKSERIADAAKLQNIRRELDSLNHVRRDNVPGSSELNDLATQLKAINEQLWEIEDAIRDCERRNDFGAEFVELARSVYRSND